MPSLVGITVQVRPASTFPRTKFEWYGPGEVHIKKTSSISLITLVRSLSVRVGTIKNPR